MICASSSAVHWFMKNVEKSKNRRNYLVFNYFNTIKAKKKRKSFLDFDFFGAARAQSGHSVAPWLHPFPQLCTCDLVCVIFMNNRSLCWHVICRTGCSALPKLQRHVWSRGGGCTSCRRVVVASVVTQTAAHHLFTRRPDRAGAPLSAAHRLKYSFPLLGRLQDRQVLKYDYVTCTSPPL